MVLLEEHFRVTLPLNVLARYTLLPGPLKALTGQGVAGNVAIINAFWKAVDCKQDYFPTHLKDRGFSLDTKELENEGYYYAADGLRIWNHLRSYVHGVFEALSWDDKKLISDQHIKSWLAELCTDVPGPKFPQIENLNDLVDFVTHIIFTASVQHSAVNYLQEYYMAFVGNYPSALFRDLPEERFIDEQFVCESLPSFRLAKLAQSLGNLLSSAPAKGDRFLISMKRANEDVSKRSRCNMQRVFDKFSFEMNCLSVHIKERNKAKPRYKAYSVLDPADSVATSVLI